MMIEREQVETLKTWVKALRSGEYKQSTGLLKSADGYCCLGVLADTKGVEWEVHEDTNSKRCSFLGNGAYALAEFQRWTGLSGEIQDTLIGMNDREKLSFAEIADFIEGYIPLEARDQ